MKEYDIIIKAEIEIGGRFYGEDAEEAKAAAVGELRGSGQLSNLTVDRCIYIDPNDEQSGAGGYDKGQEL
jgi:hypothetical protein